MAESHMAKGKSVGVLGGAIEHTEFAKFEEVYSILDTVCTKCMKLLGHIFLHTKNKFAM